MRNWNSYHAWLSAMVVVVVIAAVAASVSLPPSTTTAFAAGPQPPYWPRYSGARAVTLLDGTWAYGVLDRPAFFDSMDSSLTPSKLPTPNTTAVPSCMDVAPPGTLGTRGIAFYRRTFTATGPVRLQFQACGFYCRVWVNGHEIGDHLAGGYVAFTLDVPETNGDNNELFVLADNRFNHTTAPLATGGDFWAYGGLMRSVELHTLPAATTKTVFPWRAYVLPVSLSHVNITVVLTDANYSGSVSVSLAFDGAATASTHSIMASKGQLVLSDIAVPNPRMWSTTDPQLHVVDVEIDDAVVSERFGLRLFDVEESSARIRINGKVIKLHGWNHHTQWPDVGASPTDKQMDTDIALLKRAGTNYVRGAHYPQDPRWLDRLDENGIVMWCETLGPGVSSSNAQDPRFLSYQRQQMNEMLDNALNHASIMIWAWFNEGPSHDPDACPAYKAQADTVHARDTTRFVTWASDKDLNDVCLEHATLVAFNNYPKWYNGEDPRYQWNKFANGVRAGEPKGSLGKPFVISETGAGGIYEWSHNKTDAKWTLKLQTEIISEDVSVALENDNVSGLTLWHFFDFKTQDGDENNTHCEYEPNVYPPTCAYIDVHNGRPGGVNHKGVLGFWRREKPSYNVVAAMYNKSLAEEA